MKKTAILVFVVILVSFAAAFAQTEEPLTFQDFIEGKAAFEENCIECHSLESLSRFSFPSGDRRCLDPP